MKLKNTKKYGLMFIPLIACAPVLSLVSCSSTSSLTEDNIYPNDNLISNETRLETMSRIFNSSSNEDFKNNIKSLNAIYKDTNVDLKTKNIVDLLGLKCLLTEDLTGMNLKKLNVYNQNINNKGNGASFADVVDFDSNNENDLIKSIGSKNISFKSFDVDSTTGNLIINLNVDLEGQPFKYLILRSKMNAHYAFKITSDTISLKLDSTYSDFQFFNEIFTSYNDFLLEVAKNRDTNKSIYVGLIKENGNLYLKINSYYSNDLNNPDNDNKTNTSKIKFEVYNGIKDDIINVTKYDWYDLRIDINDK